MKEFIKKLDLKKAVPHVIAIGIFLVISSVYFYNQLSGLTVYQQDTEMHIGMSKESNDFQDKFDEETLWTNAPFGGMPTYQISMSNANIIRSIDKAFLLIIPRPIGYIVLLMLGFYIFLLLLNVDPKLAIVGSIAFGLASFNILYIEAGHNNKVHALAYIPPILGSIIYAYRKNFLIGSILLAFFGSLHLSANHMQLTYYMLYAGLAIVILQFVVSYREKTLKRFIRASLFLMLGGILSVLPSAKNILLTQEYLDSSTRGKSQLTIELDKNDANTKGAGLGKEYITEYSFGKGEISSLIIPNAKGGNFGQIGEDKELMSKVESEEEKSFIMNQNRYWGEQSYSDGAFYYGASVFLLFLLGLVFVKDKIKWPFLAVSVLAMFLSLKYGALTEFAINNFPMFSKFRDTKMILILVQISFAFIGMLFINHILKDSINKKRFLYVSGGVIALLLLFVLLPTTWFNFLSKGEVEQLDMINSNPYDFRIDPSYLPMINSSFDSLQEIRVSIFRADCFRSLFFIFLTAGSVYLFLIKKLTKTQLIVSLGLIILIDLFAVDRRYFTNEKVDGDINKWVETYAYRNPYQPTSADSIILQNEIIANPALGERIESALAEIDRADLPIRKQYINKQNQITFRELNFSTNYRVFAKAIPLGIKYHTNEPGATRVHAFSDGRTPYFHKSLGGYHGAKLKRYQDVWDGYLARETSEIDTALKYSRNMTELVLQLKESIPVMNMLNTKYIIYNPFAPPILNEGSFGNVWFVDRVKYVKDADEEFQALGHVDRSTAIVDASFQNLTPTNLDVDPSDDIHLTDYKPNHLTYKSEAKKEQLAVFSEIYYDKGWNAYIDGQKTEYFRANYLLRALAVPAGEHIIEFKFEPGTYGFAHILSIVGSILLLLYILGILGYEFYYKKMKQTVVKE